MHLRQQLLCCRLPFLPLHTAIARVQLEATQAATWREPMLFVAVVDRSSSMRGSRFAAVLDGLDLLVDQLRPDDHLAVITFDAHADLAILPTPMGPQGKAWVRHRLEGLSPGRGTNFEEALLLLTEAARAGRQLGLATHALFLTDGFPSVGALAPEPLVEVLRPAVTAGLSLSCAGIGADYDATVLAPLVEAGGGTLHDLEQADGVGDVIAAELEGASSAAFMDLRLTLSPAPEVEHVELLHALPSWRHARAVTVGLGTLHCGIPRSVLFSVDARTSPGTVRLAGRAEDGSLVLEEAQLHLTDSKADAEAIAQDWLGLQLAKALIEGWEALTHGRAAARARFEAGLAFADLVEQVMTSAPHPLARRLRAAMRFLDAERDLSALRRVANRDVQQSCVTRIARLVPAPRGM